MNQDQFNKLLTAYREIYKALKAQEVILKQIQAGDLKSETEAGQKMKASFQEGVAEQIARDFGGEIL